jgi:hypothetical protein
MLDGRTFYFTTPPSACQRSGDPLAEDAREWQGTTIGAALPRARTRTAPRRVARSTMQNFRA